MEKKLVTKQKIWNDLKLNSFEAISTLMIILAFVLLFEFILEMSGYVLIGTSIAFLIICILILFNLEILRMKLKNDYFIVIKNISRKRLYDQLDSNKDYDEIIFELVQSTLYEEPEYIENIEYVVSFSPLSFLRYSGERYYFDDSFNIEEREEKVDIEKEKKKEAIEKKKALEYEQKLKKKYGRK